MIALKEVFLQLIERFRLGPVGDPWPIVEKSASRYHWLLNRFNTLVNSLESIAKSLETK